MRLRDLVGQEHAAAILARAVATSRVPHAYLFDGPTGTGKRSAAVGLALELDCDRNGGGGSAAGGGGACGACDTCRRILAGIHPDVVTFATVGTATQIVMDQAQEIVALAQRRPHEARARVIIVDEAERLNANAANCLLKTLEEPSPGTHLVLVTPAPDRVLATIRSRTQRVRFRRLPAAALLDLGARRGLDPGRAGVAAALADGSAARFLALGAADSADGDDGGGAAVDQQAQAVAALRAAARGARIGEIFDAAAGLGDKEGKQALPEVLALLAQVYRDALVTTAGAPELAVLGQRGPAAGRTANAAAPADATAPAVELALPANLSVPALGRALAAIVETETALAGNVNPVMALEWLLLSLRREEATQGARR